jgi:hypothetical protein
MSLLTRLPRGERGRHLIVASVVIALIAAPWAVASSTGGSIVGGKRNPSSSRGAVYKRETQIIGNIAQGAGGFAAHTGGYTTRQSNKSDSGGGAIYGCRAKAGRNACVSAVNLADGSAFEFVAGDKAAAAGQIRLGSSMKTLVNQPPIATNGTGLVKNLNSDTVGGKHATDLVGTTQLMFAVVDATGKLGNTRGATGASQTNTTPPTYAVSFGTDISKCAYTATPASIAAGTLAVAPGTSNNVVVTESGTASGFHLQVTC